MAFIFGVSEQSPQGYRYAPLEIHYPEQEKALLELKFEKAADLYWKTVKETSNYGQACNAIRHKLTPKELQSDDFAHILSKRQP